MMPKFGLEIYQSTSGGFTFGLVYPEFEKRVIQMKQDGTLKPAITELLDKASFHRRKAEEFENAARVLQSLSVDNGENRSTVVMHDKEFMTSGIAEATVILIKRSNRPLHVQEVVESLKAGGYRFKTNNPVGSVAPVLYMAAKNNKHGLINKGKNTYSLQEIEKHQAA